MARSISNYIVGNGSVVKRLWNIYPPKQGISTVIKTIQSRDIFSNQFAAAANSFAFQLVIISLEFVIRLEKGKKVRFSRDLKR